MVHGEFDLELWQSRFPLHKLVEESDRWRNSRADYVTAPGELALELAIRDAAQNERGPFPTLPTDVFVFGTGEPEAPYLTKMGGRPYLADDVAWPHTDQGEATSFVAQLCFLDSRDLVGETPGDVLLIFGRTMPFNDYRLLNWEPEDGDSFQFLWASVGDADTLRAPPPGVWEFNPYYAAIHRSTDLLDPDPFTENDRGESILLPSVLPSTKIGGTPFWAQGEQALPGRFLGMVSTLKFPVDTPYPLLNDEKPRAYTSYGYGTLMKDPSLDAYLYLFLDGDTVHWTAQGS